MPLHKLKRSAAGLFGDPPVITYIGTSNNLVNSSSYTFSSVNIGSASSDRIVVAVMTNNQRTVTTPVTLSSCTIGGSAATVAGTSGDGGAASSSVGWGVAYRSIASGTTATVVFSLSAITDNCQCHIFTVTGHNGSAPTIYSDVDRAITLAVTGWHPTGAGLGATVQGNGSGATSFTCSNSGFGTITEDVDAAIGEANSSYVAYHVSNVRDKPTITIQSSIATNNEAGFLAVWE